MPKHDNCDPSTACVLIWCPASRAPYWHATRSHLIDKGFCPEKIFMLVMPLQGSLDVPLDMTSTSALSKILVAVDRCLSPHAFKVVCLAVDTFRAGTHETIGSLLQHVTPDAIFVSGYADWPTGPCQWFGGSFIACGRPGFSKMAKAMHDADPASRGMYWDNWLAKRQDARRRDVVGAQSLRVVQDVVRGGPHPRVSTTFSPDGSPQLRFGGGLCPDEHNMMGENVTRPEPIAEWISDLKKRLTLGVDLLRYTALSPDLAFQPSLDAQRPPPLQSTTLLCWMDSTSISCDDGYWTCPVDFDAGVFEQHLGGCSNV